MINEISDRKNYKIEDYFLPTILFGYIIACSFAIPLQLESRIFSVPFRVFVFLFSGVIIYRNFQSKKISLSLIMFLFFVLIYCLKAYFSFQEDNYLPQTQKDRNEFFYRIIVIDVLPFIALLFVDYSKINWVKILKISFWILFFVLLANVLYCICQLDFNKTSGIFSTYYISAGHFGVSLSIIAMFLILFDKNKRLQIKKEYLYSALFLSFFTIIVSAARSPLLTLGLISFYLIFLKKEKKYYLIFSGFILIIIVSIFYLKQNTNSNFAFVNRNFDFIFKGNSYGREFFIEKGLEIFKQNPIIGGRVLFEDFLYPHNLFVELLMSGGIILLSIFLAIYLPLLKNLKIFLKYDDLKFHHTIVFCFFAQYFILSQTSYNFISNPEFWYFSALIIGVSLNLKNEKA